MYTVSGSSRGNKALTNPVGLIIADEVAVAGGMLGTNNTTYYLYTGQEYWTMSPSIFNGVANLFSVYSGGNISFSMGSMIGVRPVINIASDVEITGSGTSTDPYVVVGAE